MIMADLSSEDNLWILFRTTSVPENGHELPGERAQEFQYVWDALIDRKSKKRPNLAHTDRFYYLYGRSTGAVVPQSDLLRVGKALLARDAGLLVQYLGTDPNPA